MKRQKILWICFLLCLGLWMTPQKTFAEEGGYHALIIGRGDYGGVNNLSPGPENDSENFRRVLEQTYGSEIVITKKEKEGVTTAAGVAAAIQEAFAGSSQDTVNYFYYCGHGNSSGLYLGSATMTASMLAEAFEGIAGTNILVIDCCFSGTLISKTGRSQDSQELFLDSFIQEFTDTLAAMRRGRSSWDTGSFHILTAASSEEQSWQGELGENGEDIGLFTSNLALGAGVNPMKISDQNAYDMGFVPADYDRDGSITFDEIGQFIRNGNYSSNLRRYPESDSTVFLETQDRSAPDVTVKKAWVTWEDGERVLKLTLDAREAGQIQCAVYRGELWNLSCLCRYVNNEQFSTQSSSKIKRIGIWTQETEAGEHTLSIPLPETETALTEGNYAVMVRGGESAAYTYMLPFSLSASEGTDLVQNLEVQVEPYFCMNGKNEFQILADFGTGSSEKLIRPYLSAVVKDVENRIVRVLGDHELVDVVEAYLNPYQYYRSFYWDGRDEEGAAVEPGLYQAELTVYNGAEEITVSKYVLTASESNPVVGIEIVNSPSQTEYQVGESFRSEGLQVAARLRQGEQIPLVEYQVEEKGPLSAEDQEIEISYGEWKTSIPITVRDSWVTGLEIAKAPDQTGYQAGERFNPEGMIVNLVYSNGERSETQDYTIDKEVLSLGDSWVTVRFGEWEARVDVIVYAEKSEEELIITKQPEKAEYLEGEDFDPSGMEVMVRYSDGDVQVVTNYEVLDSESLIPDQKEILLRRGDLSASVSIQVYACVGLEITSPPQKTLYQEGDTFDPSGMEVSLVYSNGTRKKITDYMVEQKVLTSTDRQVRIWFDDWQTYLSIEVEEKQDETPSPSEETGDSGTGQTEKSPAAPTQQPVQAASVKLNAEGKSISGKTITIGVREKVKLQALVSPANAADKAVTFRSSNSKIVSVGAGGTVTGKKKGSARITAVTANGKSCTIKVKVKKAPTKLKLGAVKKTLKRNKKYKIKTVIPKKMASYHLTYKSSRSRVASVSSNGTVTAKRKGTAVITVQTYNKKKARIKITVK